MTLKELKEKAARFWEENKWKIACLATVAAGAAVIIFGVRRDINAAEEAVDSDEELQKSLEHVLGSPECKDEETFEEKQENPTRQLSCGGWVLEDDMHNKELPLMIANDVPIASLGEFGQELIRKAEGVDLGDFNQDLNLALTSIMINLETADARTEYDERMAKSDGKNAVA